MATPTDPINIQAFLDAMSKTSLQDWQSSIISSLITSNLLPTPPKPQTATEARVKMDAARAKVKAHRAMHYRIRYGIGNRRMKDILNGKHWRPNPQTYSDPTQQPDPRDDGADAFSYSLSSFAAQWRAVNKPHEIPYAGIRTGEIIGYRAWLVIDTIQGPRLCSLAHKYIWTPKETITGDINEVVLMSWPSNIMGGIYSFNTPKMDLTISDSIEHIKRDGPIHSSIGGEEIVKVLAIATGTIEMWGDVVEHQTGYRASHAKVKSIDAVYGKVDIDELRSIYNV